MSTSTKIRLYKNHINGIGTWDIWYVDNVIHIDHATVEGGAAVHHTETVEEGKQSRSLKEQVISRIKSRISKQYDKGYVKTREEARKQPTNALNLLQPMLAQPYKRVIGIHLPTAYYQAKLDGHRCLVTKVDGEMIAYSRQGKIITSIPHILSELEKVMPEGATLDGELYCHGQTLQTIASWIKRAQPDTMKLRYHIYDHISPEPFQKRMDDLIGYEIMNQRYFDVLPTFKLHSIDYIVDLLQEHRKHGYEGLIIRHTSSGYEAGRRSHSLVKVKQFDDAEYEVRNVRVSAEGWGILDCITPEGRIFSVSAPGTHAEKREILENMDYYIGKFVTVEYSQITADRIPFHPVAIRFREDI